MKKLNKKVLFAVLAILLSNNVRGDNREQQTKLETKTTHQDLKSAEMDLFNAMLEAKPIVTARLKNALKNIEFVVEKIESHKTIEKLENGKESTKYNLDNKTLNEYKKQILKPIEIFFEIIHENTFVVKPLVTKSVSNPDSILIKFFDAKASEVPTFFEKNVTTAEILDNACNDFLKFLGDIEYHLSKQAKSSYEKLVKKIKQKK